MAGFLDVCFLCAFFLESHYSVIRYYRTCDLFPVEFRPLGHFQEEFLIREVSLLMHTHLLTNLKQGMHGRIVRIRKCSSKIKTHGAYRRSIIFINAELFL